MTLEALLATVALEYKYNCGDKNTMEKLSSVYLTTTGRKPNTNTNVLGWFLKNYQFDGSDCTWYHRDRALPN